MLWGVCVGPESVADAAAAGFRSVELPLEAVAALSEEAFAALRADLLDRGLQAPALNRFLPRGMPVVGPDVDERRLEAYLQRALPRAAAVGARVLVLGSGHARRIPPGFSRREAEEQFISFARLAGGRAESHGLAIALEPLNRGEANLMNTLREGWRMAQSCGHPAVGLIADLFHMALEGEDLADVRLPGASLLHVHVADPQGRLAPGGHSPKDLYLEFFRHLQAASYEGAISIEGAFAAPEGSEGAQAGASKSGLPRFGPRAREWLELVWSQAGEGTS